MCELITASLAAIGTSISTAAGATAAAATALPLAGIGTALSIGGSLIQGVNTYKAGKAQARALEQQARDERSLAAVADQRTRAQFRTAISKQMSELAARGVSLDSPSAILLGQTAAQEMSFESQSVRSQGAARTSELSSAAAIARGQARSGLLKGGFDAAGTFLTRAPDLWPELLK